MRGELIAIDLETTGLDPTKDAIIEIGAVRLIDGKIGDEYSTLVNPGCPIPEQVVQLTGISQEDVASAPPIDIVLPQIAAFVKDVPVIAHNISFDMGFLRGQHHILTNNTQIDTYDLAAVLLPSAPRYNLNSLTQQLGITLERAHRALSDARATALLYWELWRKVLALPSTILEEIGAAAQGLDWDTGSVFSAALREGILSSRESIDPSLAFTPLHEIPVSLCPNPEKRSITGAEIAELIGADGALWGKIPHFAYRPQQEEMVKAIADAFNGSEHLIMEAGTGVGKSIAYLLAASLWSIRNNERVVISTNTITLQDQLVNKDIPLLQSALNLPFTVAVVKGRNNYLCPRRLAAMRRRRPVNTNELRMLSKILIWLLESKTGDKSEINLRWSAEESIWQRLSAQNEDCIPLRCETAMGGICPFYKAHKMAEAANLLVVNHALLISDASTENQVLPEYHYVIIDEAHHLEKAITDGLSFYIDKATLSRHLADLGGIERGLLGELLVNAHNHIPRKEAAQLEQFVQIVSEATAMMDIHLQRLFAGLYELVQDVRETPISEYSVSVRLDQRLRRKPSFDSLRSIWITLNEFFEVVGAAAHRLAKSLRHLEGQEILGLVDLLTSTEAIARYLEEARQQLQAFMVEPDPNMIYWVSLFQGAESPAIHTAPLQVGPIVEKCIWHGKESVILTSATLGAQDDFEYIRERLYADTVKTLEFASPFDYQKTTLVYVPDDIPEPNDRQEYQRVIERGIIELATALEGRTLVLFTSHSQLRQTAQAISPRLSLGDIVVYDQSDGSSKQALLDGFKTARKAVLLGAQSFWEGIDIPGDALSALVMVRLPFVVPTDPIFSARSDAYANAFQQYALPEAILRFRQGFGRLIRTTTDRGVVAIFDSRVLRKNYGARFLEALPDCVIRHGSLDALPEIARSWLNPDSIQDSQVQPE